MEVTVALIVAIVIAFVFLLQKKRPHGMPPGPRGLPLFGNIFSLGGREYEVLSRWAEEFGPIYSYYMFGQPVIVLNSFAAIQEAFVGHAESFSGRPSNDYIRMVTHDSGVIFKEGSFWQERRRFLLRVLKSFGAGHKQGEMVVQEECMDLVTELRKMSGGVVTAPVFNSSVNNVIARFTFGERCGAEDPQFKEFAKKMGRLVRFGVLEMLPGIVPVLWKVKPLYSLFKLICDGPDAVDFIHQYIDEKVQEHARRLPDPLPGLDEARDVCDAILIEQGQKDGHPGADPFTNWQVIRELMELFLAGTETTSITLAWITVLMATHPDIQRQVQKEIETAIGRERCPTMADRQQLPLVCAVLEECFRFSSLASVNVPHRVTKDVEIMGFTAPEGALVTSNLFAVHRDPEFWERPYEFYPGHFLTEDGKFKPSKHLIGFSMGKRACLGESMARMEAFLMTVSMFQAFSVRLEDPNVDVAKLIDGGDTIIRKPRPHKIVFTSLE